MDNQHTPGPWKWHRRYISDDRNGCIFSEPIEGHAYAIAMQPRYSSNEQWSADCRLIVAAHDLLAACREFVRKVECGEAKSVESYEQMKTAIAKAEGNTAASVTQAPSKTL